MTFTFRKSKTLGPIRLNLSSSGLGLSLGSKYGRIGISPTGKTYVSGGIRGIRFHENLGKITSGRQKECQAEPPGSLDLEPGILLNEIVEYHDYLEPEVGLSRKQKFRRAMGYVFLGWFIGMAGGMDGVPGSGWAFWRWRV